MLKGKESYSKYESISLILFSLVDEIHLFQGPTFLKKHMKFNFKNQNVEAGSTVAQW